MHPARVIALGYRYPTLTSADDLAAAVDADAHGAIGRSMARFVEAVTALSLDEWEELHTATLDLAPKFVPYVGHVVWGDNYRRGEFMAALNGAMSAVGVDVFGELPDHLEPILRYLSETDEPLEDLVDVLPGAVDAMADMLEKSDADSPYCHLLEATAAYTADLRPLTIGGRS